MSQSNQGGGVCPYCEADKANLNSHIVQSDGGRHGPMREYPEDWDPDARERAESDEPDGSRVEGDGGGEPTTGGEVFELDSGDGDGDPGEGDRGDEPDAETGTLELGFEDSEPREYECGDCGEPLPYLGGDDRDGGGKECPSCGERLWWSEVEA